MKRFFFKLGGKRGEADGGAGSGLPATTAGTPQPRQALAPENSGPAISPMPLPYDPAAYGWLPAAEAAQLSPAGSRALSPALSGAGSGMSRARSARRPREALEFGVMLLPEPGAAKQQQVLPQPPPALTPAEAEDAGLAAALAASDAKTAEEAARGGEAAAEAEYQAAVDKAVEDSLASVDYDALLRDIRLWVMDLEGATGDVAAAREEASGARAKLDADMAAADPDEPDGWHRLCWLSEQYPIVEARLAEVSARVAPIADAVQGLKDLIEFINKEKPALDEAEGVRDAIIAKLFEDLGRQGLDPNHPLGAYGREGGGRGSEAHAADLRDLVQALIEEARRLGSPPPLPRKAPEPEPEPTPAPMAEEPEQEEEVLESDPEPEPQQPEPEPEPEAEAEPEPEPEPELEPEPEPEPRFEEEVAPEPEPQQPELEPEPEPEPEAEKQQKQPLPAVSPPVALPPTPQPSGGREPAPKESRSPRQAPGASAGGRFRAPKLSEAPRRRRREAVHPVPEDRIQRVPTIVTLHHELGRGGVVADAVGWQRWAGGAPTRKAAVPPSPARRAGAASPAKSAASPAKPVAPPAVDAARGAEVAALTPASLAEVAEFVAEQKARYGEAALPPAGVRWRVMDEAAAVYDSLVNSIASLGSWEVAPGAKVPPEARRLAVYMDEVSKQAGCVTYPHDRLRQALTKQGLPWDPSLLVDLRWAAQHAAAALMQAALEATNEACKQKRAWQTSAVLEPLGCAAMAVFRVHQFCGGFNKACTALWAEVYERIDHWGRSIDPKWLRNTRQVNA